jgi:hypothetical protein
MACKTLTASRNKPCASSIAGIRAISFGVFDPMNRVVTTSTGVIALATKYAANTLARFDVKNTTAKYLENGTKGADTNGKNVKGSVMLTLAIPPATADHLAVTEIVDTFIDREWVCFIEYKDGTIVAAGSQFGAEVLVADGDTGGTANDLNGYTVTISTDESDYSRKYALSGAGLTDYAAALMDV